MIFTYLFISFPFIGKFYICITNASAFTVLPHYTKKSAEEQYLCRNLFVGASIERQLVLFASAFSCRAPRAMRLRFLFCLLGGIKICQIQLQITLDHRDAGTVDNLQGLALADHACGSGLL